MIAVVAMAATTTSAQFVAYSSPYFRGSSQTFKETPGCYQLSGNTVASFRGVDDSRYTFYRNGGCSGKVVYTSTSAPVKSIRPSIRPKSVKILASYSDTDDVTLVTYARPQYSGQSQSITGTGCILLKGIPVSSFEGYGGYRYKFYSDRGCNSYPLLQSKGGDKSNTQTINPYSVYVYKN
ncbi:hypothetical protein BGZ76_006829 [Entomortierella beljakovae]|nr:hypothetical protein BGZ76_006829 [Entomortierella beljakovae]